MRKPLLLDLFAGAGGAGVGYARAGFRVVGVDHIPQPSYPFPLAVADAVEFVARHGRDYDLIHASPPCQGYSRMARAVPTRAPRMIEVVREALVGTGRPFVIENVEGAPLDCPLLLCGTMFGLSFRRHRLFEIHPPLLLLTSDCSCRLGVQRGRLVGHRTSGRVGAGRIQPPDFTEDQRRTALGAHWMTAREARQAVPPAFTQFIGARLLRAGLP